MKWMRHCHWLTTLTLSTGVCVGGGGLHVRGGGLHWARRAGRMRLVTDLQEDDRDAALPLAYDPDAINRCVNVCV